MAPDSNDIIPLIQPMVRLTRGLSTEARIVLLLCMLAQEICRLPPSDRDEEMRRVLREFPDVLDVTEATMREQLVKKARRGQ